jgi:hypothetical protein
LIEIHYLMFHIFPYFDGKLVKVELLDNREFKATQSVINMIFIET